VSSVGCAADLGAQPVAKPLNLVGRDDVFAGGDALTRLPTRDEFLLHVENALATRSVPLLQNAVRLAVFYYSRLMVING
jgi:hypothetical protein